MSEFKYACPVCGQHIKCDSSQAGTKMECPTCFQKIVVPQAPASEDQKFILHGTKVGTQRPLPAAATDVPPLPVPEKPSPWPAIIVGILVFAVAAVLFVFRGKIFKSAGDTDRAPNQRATLASNSSATAVSANGTEINVALNKPAAASSYEAQNPVQNGNDGNTETRWCASNGGAPQWWEVNLGGNAVITNTQILWEHSAIYQYAVEVSSNHTNWTVVADRTANQIESGENSDNFSASGRYVRVVITGLQSGSWASFYEFRAFGSTPARVNGGAITNGHSPESAPCP